jgi:dephospho-CoA kinase
MKVIGLTGGIGTGKSTVAGMLRRLGATVIDADRATREVQARGSEGLRRIVEEFGSGILRPDGELDRERLGALVFKDPRARERLNRIVHPLVRAWMAERLAEAQDRRDRVAVLDIPLLFESRGTAGLDSVILVYAPKEVQLWRLVHLRGMSEEQAQDRIAAQLPIEVKRQMADYVIVNTGSMDQLRAEVERVWRAVLAGL